MTYEDGDPPHAFGSRADVDGDIVTASPVGFSPVIFDFCTLPIVWRAARVAFALAADHHRIGRHDRDFPLRQPEVREDVDLVREGDQDRLPQARREPLRARTPRRLRGHRGEPRGLGVLRSQRVVDARLEPRHDVLVGHHHPADHDARQERGVLLEAVDELLIGGQLVVAVLLRGVPGFSTQASEGSCRG
jgi:hypothetical protein